ncbi:hypothetical protein CR513_31875, partial [Mucuna pruriens]
MESTFHNDRRGRTTLDLHLFNQERRHIEASCTTNEVNENEKMERTKRLKVTDLFDIRQAKGENLKSYLTRFNNATIRINDPDQKLFVKAFQKGLRTGQFSDVLTLR